VVVVDVVVELGEVVVLVLVVDVVLVGDESSQ